MNLAMAFYCLVRTVDAFFGHESFDEYLAKLILGEWLIFILSLIARLFSR